MRRWWLLPLIFLWLAGCASSPATSHVTNPATATPAVPASLLTAQPTSLYVAYNGATVYTQDRTTTDPALVHQLYQLMTHAPRDTSPNPCTNSARADNTGTFFTGQTPIVDFDVFPRATCPDVVLTTPNWRGVFRVNAAFYQAFAEVRP